MLPPSVAAALAEGFSVRRIRDTPNAQINISAKAWAIFAAPGEGMTTPTESDERDRVMRIIQARCSELTDSDLEALAHADTASIEAVLPDEIGERIMDAIAALEEKLDQLVAAIGDGDADDLTG
jgi:hypothetical protein